MFNKNYFNDLFSKTNDYIHKKNYKKGSDEYKKFVEPNLAVLKVLADDIDNNETRMKLLHSIELMEKKDTKLENEKKENKSFVDETDTNKKRIEKELLGFSKKLKEKAYKFKDKLFDDEKILEDVESGIQQNLTTASGNLKNLKTQTGQISMIKLTSISLLIFLIMYFFIRFY